MPSSFARCIARASRALLLPLCILAVVGGCGYVARRAAHVAITPVVAAVTSTGGATRPATPGSRVVTDGGLSWERAILLADGSPFDPHAYRRGDPVRARWSIPLRIGGDVRAVAAIADRGCVTTSPEPTRWDARPTAFDDAGASEAWYLSRQSLADRDATDGRRRIGYAAGVTLAQRLGLAASYDLLWLVLVPGPGEYRLVLTWDAADPATVAAASPCIAGWLDVPFEMAMGATLGQPTPLRPGASGAPRNRAATVPRSGGGLTTDAGLSLADVGAADDSSPEVVGVASLPPGTNTERVAADLGLTQRPDYDLVRLHQTAVDLELFGVTQEASGERGTLPARLATPEGMGALRALRAHRLVALRALPAATLTRFCLAAMRQGLTTRPIQAWDGLPTVPPGADNVCAAERLAPQR